MTRKNGNTSRGSRTARRRTVRAQAARRKKHAVHDQRRDGDLKKKAN